MAKAGKRLILFLVLGVIIGLAIAVYFIFFSRPVVLKSQVPGWKLTAVDRQSLERVVLDSLVQASFGFETLQIVFTDELQDQFTTQGQDYKVSSSFSRSGKTAVLFIGLTPASALTTGNPEAVHTLINTALLAGLNGAYINKAGDWAISLSIIQMNQINDLIKTSNSRYIKLEPK